jgi:hypothetical protein
MNAAWSPIVYSKTHSMDFRMLVLPQDLEQSEVSDIHSFIASSLEYPEKLRDCVRFSLVKTVGYCMIGLSCTADQLTDKSWVDRDNRRFQMFVGYISRNLNALIPPPSIAMFQQLAQIAKDLWLSGRLNQPTHHDYSFLSSELLSLSVMNQGSKYSYNNDISNEVLLLCQKLAGQSFGKVRVWDSSELINIQLWQAAAINKHPVSLCMNLPSERDARQGEFKNVTIVRQSSKEVNYEFSDIENSRNLLVGGSTASPEISTNSSRFSTDEYMPRNPKKSSTHRNPFLSFIEKIFSENPYDIT